MVDVNINEVIKGLKYGRNANENSKILAEAFEKGNLVYIEYMILTDECSDGFIGSTIRKFVGENVLKEIVELASHKAIEIKKIETRK